MSVRPYYVRTSTMKHNAATNQRVVFVRVDETFTTIDFQGHSRSGSRSGDDLSPLSGQFLVINVSSGIFRYSYGC